jgi:hypothetical protein
MVEGLLGHGFVGSGPNYICLSAIAMHDASPCILPQAIFGRVS